MAGVRKAFVAGQFYPRSASECNAMLKEFAAGVDEKKIAGVKPKAVVAPHAGWIYSGQTAAYAYQAVKKATPQGETVVFVVLSPNHTGYGAAVAVSALDWQTPLGIVKNNAEFREALLEAAPVFEVAEEAHAMEHSIEVQLPFLQYYFTDFSFVPVTFLDQSLQAAKTVGEAITSVAKKSKKLVFVVASSDFTHYEPAAQARAKDERVIAALRELNVEAFYKALHETRASACGYAPIAAAAVFAKACGAKKSVLLDFSNSGKASGDASVVDYAALAFE
ncbi:MAG: AmmeMemoRadiSam system protein B [Candidatus Norongarragalinales archaeon]